jgi:hypothetical protein
MRCVAAWMDLHHVNRRSPAVAGGQRGIGSSAVEHETTTSDPYDRDNRGRGFKSHPIRKEYRHEKKPSSSSRKNLPRESGDSESLVRSDGEGRHSFTRHLPTVVV